MIRPSRLLS